MKKKINNYFAKLLFLLRRAPLQFIFSVFNLLISLLFYYGFFGVSLFTSILSLICFLPFYGSLYFIEQYLRCKDKMSKIFYNVVTLFFILPFIIFQFMMAFICSLFSVVNDYPISDFNEYWRAYRVFDDSIIGEFLPKKQSDTIKFNRFYYQEGILQGGTTFLLEVQVDDKTITEYKDKLESREIFVDEDTLKLIQSSCEDGSHNLESYKIYYLRARCDGSGYCNHGEDAHVSIREKSNEITFYYSYW